MSERSVSDTGHEPRHEGAWALAFELSLDPAETVRASQEIARRARESSILRLVAFWLLIPATALLVFKGGLEIVAVFTAIFALLGLLALVSPVIQRRKVRRFYTETPTLAGPQRYAFTEEGLAVSNAGAENLLRWPAIVEAAETPEFFLIYFAKNCAYYLPKRIVGSQVREDRVRGLLRAKLGERATHIAPPQSLEVA